MLHHYMNNLQNSILWAKQEDDIDMLFLVKQRMDQLLTFVNRQSLHEQQKIYHYIDSFLPMEWPLWMEACRYSDEKNIIKNVLH